MKLFTLKLTSAIAIDGEVLTKDTLVEVEEALAKNLLHRGKAVLATAEDGVDDDGHVDENDLSKLKKDQLLPLAESYGIEGADKMKVDDLRTAIAAKQAE